MADQNPLQGVKVMVIDDSNTIRRSAEIFLLQAGCTVILAEDGDLVPALEASGAEVVVLPLQEDARALTRGQLRVGRQPRSPTITRTSCSSTS